MMTGHLKLLQGVDLGGEARGNDLSFLVCTADCRSSAVIHFKIFVRVYES